MISPWLTATVAQNATTSGEVDLGNIYRRLVVLIPTLDSSTVTVHISDESSGTFYPVNAFDADTTGDFAHATSAGTAAKAVVFRIGGAQYIKVVCGSSQSSSARTFLLRGG